MKPGIYKGISHKDYHTMTEIVSNSYLGRLDRCPAAAKVAFPDGFGGHGKDPFQAARGFGGSLQGQIGDPRRIDAASI